MRACLCLLVLVASACHSKSATRGDAGNQTDAATNGDGAVSTDGSTPPTPGAPVLFYTDLVSGSGTGGDNGNGAYVNVYGSHLSSITSVTLGGQPAIIDCTLCTSSEHHAVFQVGAMAASGNLIVTNASGASNTLTFTVTPTDYYFVAPTGSDTNAGTETHMKLRFAATVALALSACAPQSSGQSLGVLKPGTTVNVGGVDVHMVTSTLATAASAPSGYVATPHGYYHQSCVYGVDATTDATSLLNAPCAYPRVLIVSTSGNAPDVADGWIEDASYTAPSPATKMTSTFVVPSAPSDAAAQLDYFFPGMEPADGSIILQPVLAWGSNPAGGGNYWSLASWSCGPSCVHGNLVEAAVGDKVSGTITGSSCTTSGSCNWSIVTKDTTSGSTSTLTTTGDTEAYVWLFSGVLEAYNVSACDQYPKAGKLEFSTVKFYDSTSKMIKPTWTTQTIDSSLGCNYGIKSTEETATLSFAPASGSTGGVDLGVASVDLAGGTQDFAVVGSTCQYSCADYGFAAGQCYSDWQCGSDGCLTQVTSCP